MYCSLLIIAAKLAAAQGISTRPGIEPPPVMEVTGKQEVVQVTVNGEVIGDTGKDDEEKRKRQDEDAKKKKEEDEKTKEAKQQDKSRPISSTPVPGTPW